MAICESGYFGTPIPQLKDIVEIDGDCLVSKNGDKFQTNLIKVNKILGGGLELINVSEGNYRRKDELKPKED